MENSKELTFEERKRIQLEMLDEIDKFCNENGIRYSLAFGTLLGAIRHKGFIPWDDDVDIMMPLPDLIKFKKTFKSEICEYVDVDTDKNYGFAFSRIAYSRTYSSEGMVYKGPGVCIDLYIIVGLPGNSEEFFLNLENVYNQRVRFNRYRRYLIKRLPIKTIPLHSFYMKKYRNYYLMESLQYSQASKFYIIAGKLSLRNKMTYDKDIFSSLITAKFEDKQYKIIEDWDYFLSLRYGDYMQLPPEDQRHPYHHQHYFWK